MCVCVCVCVGREEEESKPHYYTRKEQNQVVNIGKLLLIYTKILTYSLFGHACYIKMTDKGTTKTQTRIQFINLNVFIINSQETTNISPPLPLPLPPLPPLVE